MKYQRIKVTVSKEEEVSVSDYQVLGSAINVVLQHAGFDSDWFLKNGLIMHNDRDWRHGSLQEIVVREASESDIKVFSVLNFLRELKAIV